MNNNLIDESILDENKDTTNNYSLDEYYAMLHQTLYEACIEDPHVATILSQVLDEHSSYLEAQTL